MKIGQGSSVAQRALQTAYKAWSVGFSPA